MNGHTARELAERFGLREDPEVATDPVDAGTDVVSAIRAFRAGDEEALRRHLKSVAAFGALELFDRRLGDDGDERASMFADEGSSSDDEGGSSRLVTLPRLALVAGLAGVGYLLFSRRQSDDPFPGVDEDLGVNDLDLDDPIEDDVDDPFDEGAGGDADEDGGGVDTIETGFDDDTDEDGDEGITPEPTEDEADEGGETELNESPGDDPDSPDDVADGDDEEEKGSAAEEYADDDEDADEE